MQKLLNGRSIYRASAFYFFFTVISLVVPSPPIAQANPDQLVFGPQQFLGTGGAPHHYTETFSISSSVEEPFLLHIVNGNHDGTNRLSSAWVSVNGVQVAGPRDFNNNVAIVERAVQLNPSNNLDVKVAGQPGGFLSITVLGTAILPTPTRLTPDPLTITVGSTGNLMATFTPTPVVPGTLSAISTDTGVVTVPANLAFDGGQGTVSIPITAVAPGTANISVLLNGGEVSSSVIVTPQPPTVTSLLPGSMSITQGGTGNLTVTMSAAQSSDVDISLVSHDPGIASVPGFVTIPAGQTIASLTVSANTVGMTQITAQLNGSTVSSILTVTPNLPTITSLLLPANPVDLGGTVTLVATISAAQPTETLLTVTASPAGILTIPAQVVVAAGQTFVSFDVQAVRLGTAMVQVALNGTTADAAVHVTPTPPEVISLLSERVPLVVGATGQLTLSLNVAQQSKTELRVSTDNSAVVQVPSTLTVPAGQISSTFTVSGSQVGSAVVTITLGTSTVQASVEVMGQLPPTVLSSPPNSLEIQTEATGHFTITLNAAQPVDTTVPLTNNAPLIVNVPATVTVPAGRTSVEVPVTGLSSGNAIVTASLNGSSASTTVFVLTVPSVVTALTPTTPTLPKGVPAVLRVFVSPAPRVPMAVSVTSSIDGVVAAPVMVTIPAGDLFADFPILTNGEGSAVITASLNGRTALTHVNVTPAELVTLTISPQDPTEFVGAQLPFTVIGTLTDGTQPDLTGIVTWSSSDDNLATIATDGVLSAHLPGTVMVSATSGAVVASSLLTILPTPTLSLDPPTVTLQVGETVPFTVTTSEPADVGGLTVMMSQSGSGTVTITPASLVLPVGEARATFSITGDVPGALTLRATAPVRKDGVATLTVDGGGLSITNVSPPNGPIGTAITLHGQGFDPLPSNNQIIFAGSGGPVVGIITTATSTTLTTTVPQQAVTGSITVVTSQESATSPQPFTVSLSEDFILNATPAQLTVLRGGQGHLAIGLLPVGSFTGLVQLVASGLPVGITAQFSSPTLTAGQTTYLSVSTSGTLPLGPVSFTLTGTSQLDNGPSTQTLPVTINVVGNNSQSQVAGQFRVLPDGIPISNVRVNIGSVQGQTDAAGNFVLQNVPTGSQLLHIDANVADPGMPIYSVNLDIGAGQAITLPPFWLTRPPQHLTPINNATSDQVIADPQIPGVEFTLPAGVTITGWDGVVKTQAGILKYSPDRLPVPSPPVPIRSLYHLHFGTPMGGLPTEKIPVTVPNDLGLDPGQEAEMWFFDSSPNGGPGMWKMAGLATVSEDGTRIISNPGVGLDRFCGTCAIVGCNNKNGQAGFGPNHNVSAPKALDPVDLSNGLFTVEETDLVLPGRLPVVIGRSYSPFDQLPLLFPPSNLPTGWHFSVDVWQVPLGIRQPFKAQRIYLPGNVRLDMALQPDGTYVNRNDPFLAGAVLTLQGQGPAELRFKDGTIWRFTNGALSEQEDRNGNRIRIERSGRIIQRIVDSVGRIVKFSTDAQNRIREIRDPIGRTVKYTYDVNGRLSIVTNPAGGTTQYTYDPAGRITSITDARGITFLENFYGSSGRLLRQVTADGAESFVRYQTVGADVRGPGCPGLTCPTVDTWENYQNGYEFFGGTVTEAVVVDPMGHTTSNRVNNYNFPSEQTNGQGQQRRFERDQHNQITASIDPLGRRTEYQYDVMGNISSIKTPAGSSQTEVEFSPTISRITSIKDVLGNRTLFQYDTKGNLTSFIDPEQHRSEVTYNPFGEPLSFKEPSGQVTRFEYDGDGNLIATIDPLGNRTVRTYDAVSRLITVTDARGLTTRFSYNNVNQITKMVDPLGGVTSLSYDPNGNLLLVTDALSQSTTFFYDVMDRMVKRQDALGRVETFTYDKNGNLRSWTNRQDETTHYFYDELNRQASVSYADGNSLRFAYDALGNLKMVEDSDTGKILLFYDRLNQLIKEVSPFGSIEYEYDEAGRRVTMTVGGAPSIRYIYDAASRLKEINRGGETIALDYDESGRRQALRYSNGAQTNYEYDLGSRLTRIYHQGPAGNLIDELLYTYDGEGNRISATRAMGTAADLPLDFHAQYNTVNEQILVNAPSQNLLYNHKGGLESFSDGSGTLQFSWDARNRLAGILGPGIQATFRYDGFDRRLTKTVNGITSHYVYDGSDIVQEIGSGLTNTTGYIRSFKLDEAFQSFSGTPRNMHADALGSALAQTNTAGEVTARYSYEPFGASTRSGTDLTSFQFTGRENDGTGLYFYRARYYHPQLRRFVSPDPIGMASGSLNPYVYVGNSPLLKTDPLGLYEREVHYDLTLWMALQVGFSKQSAEAIAAGNQGLDDNTGTNALFNPLAGGYWHFTHERQRRDLWQQALSTNKYHKKLGEFLHAVQDSYSHHGYSAIPFGHIFYSMLDGHFGFSDPDNVCNNLFKAQEMARDTYLHLRAFLSQRRKEQLPYRWDLMEQMVGRKIRQLGSCPP